MSLKIDAANAVTDQLIIHGQSINNKWWYITIIKQHNSLPTDKGNEGNFTIIIPKNNKYYSIITTLFSDKPSISFENNVDIKDSFFDYSKYNIPPEVWLCVYGSIEAII